jgi:hypothetical protein
MKGPLTALLLGVSFAITACAGAGHGTISTVRITGAPANLALKLGQSYDLDAIAMAGATALSGYTFIWTSSDDTIATVDASGVVTAKRIGSLTITAGTAGVTGSATLQTYGLEFHAGSSNAPALIANSPEFAFSYKVRNPDSTTPANVSFSLTGPPAWGNAFSFNKDLAADSKFDTIRVTNTLFLAGTYTLTASFGGETYTARAEVTDTSDLLPRPTGVTLVPTSTSQVQVTWNPVLDAKSYVVRLTTADFKTVIATGVTTGTGGTFKGLTLDARTQYRVRVTAYNHDTSDDTVDILLPAIIKLSHEVADFSTP